MLFPLFAIGHSTRPLENFLRILTAHEVRLLADIRTLPKSRHNPQYNKEALEETLLAAGIRYVHLKELGGLRHPRKDSVNLAWENAGFRGYADYMQTPEFDAALAKLMEYAQKERVAFMCAEGNPYRCHRLLVADALTARGAKVFHISSPNTAKRHVLSRFAKVADGKVSYPK